MLPFEANSLGEKERVKGKQKTGKVTEDEDEASAQIMGFRGVPWQSTCSSRQTTWMIVLPGEIHQTIRRALMTRADDARCGPVVVCLISPFPTKRNP